MPQVAQNFTTTHWSVVLAAGNDSTQASMLALEKLCTSYWYPLYAYVRRRGYPVEEAQDLTQEFFARFLEKKFPSTLAPEKGRFRSYLLTALNHFLVNQAEYRSAKKRGGGLERVQFDMEQAEADYVREAAEHLTPEKIFERRWACQVLDHGLKVLEDEYRRARKAETFDALKHYLLGDTEAGTYADIANASGMTEPTVRTAIFRLRRRYGQVLREQIAHTVGTEKDIDDELQHLFEALAPA